MPKHELNTLLEIKQNPSLSQRSLSRKLNISLGLTNAIIKNLIHRGWLKVKKDTGRKLLYIITPEGMVNVSRLMYTRFQETLHYYHYTKDLLTAYLMKLYQQGEKTINIYGTGQLAEITYYARISTPLKLNAIISDDPSKKIFLGHEVLTLSDFIEKYSQQLSEKSQKELLIISTISPNKLQQEIKKHKNISKNIKIINIESILKNSTLIPPPFF
ncbi:MAG: winged helix-turn-helix transcriptional regulator [Atribacterota bacterium]|nr:winged helix-turn-helix transcriptional regulator [Atribacterota bacterium]